MTLQNNGNKINTIKNTTLPELIAKINSLPDAGSGGGSGGGGYKVAIGECAANTNITLEFEPVFVAFLPNATDMQNQIQIASFFGNFEDASYSNNARAAATNSSVALSKIGGNATINGNQIKYSTSMGSTLSSYLYIAIGE